MNIYDFIDNPYRAVSGGYRPSYLTKVSFLLSMVYSLRWFTGSGSRYTSFGINETVIDNIRAISWALIWSLFVISMPVICWLVALLPLGGNPVGVK